MIHIDKRGDRPDYRQLADYLRDRILDGTYRPGAVIPSEARLRQESGLGRNSVRTAVDILVAEGLVTKQRGRGTVVRERPTRETVHVSGNDEIVARMPADSEAREMELDGGVPVLEVLRHGETHPTLYAGDQTKLKVRC